MLIVESATKWHWETTNFFRAWKTTPISSFKQNIFKAWRMLGVPEDVYSGAKLPWDHVHHALWNLWIHWYAILPAPLRPFKELLKSHFQSRSGNLPRLPWRQYHGSVQYSRIYGPRRWHPQQSTVAVYKISCRFTMDFYLSRVLYTHNGVVTMNNGIQLPISTKVRTLQRICWCVLST